MIVKELSTEKNKSLSQRRAIGLWDVDSEDELVDKITDTTGWCVKSIDYQPNAPIHSFTHPNFQ